MDARPATIDDIAALIETANGVVAEDRWVTPEPGDRRFDDEYWRASLTGVGGCVLVACSGAALVGLARLSRARDGRLQLGMMVRKGNRRRGYGKALLNAAIQWAAQSGPETLFLSVYKHNTPALELYRRTGFHELRIFPAYCKRGNGNTWDLVEMVLPLPGSAQDQQSGRR
jgi:ribosomal protein S18 acetylase RimI-like enzyme